MAKNNQKPGKLNLQTLLMIACAVLLLAVIVVSALAYTWHSDLVAMTKRARTLQISASSVESLTNEITELQLQNGTLQGQLEAAEAELQELKAAAEAEAPEAEGEAAAAEAEVEAEPTAAPETGD